jgi:hypothetical protein
MLGQLLARAAPEMALRVVEVAMRDDRRDELLRLLRNLAICLICNSWNRPATKGELATSVVATEPWYSLTATDEDQEEDQYASGIEEVQRLAESRSQEEEEPIAQIELGKRLLILVPLSLKPPNMSDDEISSLLLLCVRCCHKVFVRHDASRVAVFEALLARATDSSQAHGVQEACTSVLAALVRQHPRMLLAILTHTVPHWYSPPLSFTYLSSEFRFITDHVHAGLSIARSCQARCRTGS